MASAGTAIGWPLARDDCDSSPPPALRAGSARNDNQLGTTTHPHMRLTFLLLAALSTHALAQGTPPDTGSLPARLAWERGDYPEALRGFTKLLEAPGGDRYLEEIALITGELYRTTELTRDGRNVRVSPSGKLGA